MELQFPKRMCSCGRQDNAIDSCPICTIPKGWQCPLCFKVHSPDVKACDHKFQADDKPGVSTYTSIHAGIDATYISNTFTGIMTIKHTNGLSEMIQY